MINETLGYYWQAVFDNGDIIAQYDNEKNEILFKEVLDKENELTEFSIISTEFDEGYTVNLVNKTIKGPGFSYTLTGTNPELIYFRRNFVRQSVGGVIEPLVPRVVHHLGIKTSTQEQKLEIFKGLGARPKKIEFNNVKKKEKEDLTETVGKNK